MCLYPKIIPNRKYTQNKKNGGTIPTVCDERTLYAPIGCGECIECRKRKAREWLIRLQEDIKINTNGKFITLTFSNESIQKLNTEIPDIIYKKRKNWDGIEIIKEVEMIGYKRDNEIAKLAVHRFRERWRKQHKKSIRHWLITELGHNGTENIHMHGIIWTNESYDEIEKHWQYGYIWPRKYINDKGTWKRHNTYVNNKTINYTIKYVYKTDERHSTYKSKILTSAGIGSNYTNNNLGNWHKNKYNGIDTNETYKTSTGHKISIPIYYKNKIYTDEEKEKLWINKLDKEERWILGQKISIKNGEEKYYKALKEAQKINKELGYGNGKTKWIKEQYEQERRVIMLNKRINNKDQ